MTALLLWIGVALDIGVLVGIVVRRRVRHAISLAPLLVALIASAVTVGVCPACNTWPFWLAKEFIHAGLFLLLGLELAWRLFPSLPKARSTARLWFAFVLVAMAALLLTAPHGPVMVQALPRIAGAIACLYAGLTLVLAVWRVPISTFHDALLSGLSVYAILYAVTWAYLSTADTAVANVINPTVFNVVMAYLAWVVWRREDPPPAPPVLVRWLQPWR